MKILIERKWRKEDYTIGILSVNGVRLCNTLEDAVRSEKVYGKTAIPAGTYRVLMNTVSQKFQDRAWAKPYGGLVPRLRNVPDFQGVLIHPGNTAADTDGCILVGDNTIKGQLTNSTNRYYQLMGKLLAAALAGEAIDITILNS
jgi:hypothetical protein